MSSHPRPCPLCTLPPGAPPQTVFVSASQAAAHGYGSVSTLRKCPELPEVRFGGSVRYRLADLEARGVTSGPRGAAAASASPPLPDPVQSSIDRLVAAAPPLTPAQVRLAARQLALGLSGGAAA